MLRRLLDRLFQRLRRLRELPKLAVDTAKSRPAVAVLRIQRQRRPQLARSVLIVGSLHVQNSQEVWRFGLFGIEAFGGFELRDRMCSVILHLVGEAKIVVELCKVRRESQRSLQLNDCIGKLIQLHQRGREVLMRNDIARREHNRPLQEREGLRCLLRLAKRHAQVDHHRSIVGARCKNSAEQRY